MSRLFIFCIIFYWFNGEAGVCIGPASTCAPLPRGDASKGAEDQNQRSHQQTPLPPSAPPPVMDEVVRQRVFLALQSARTYEDMQIQAKFLVNSGQLESYLYQSIKVVRFADDDDLKTLSKKSQFVKLVKEMIEGNPESLAYMLSSLLTAEIEINDEVGGGWAMGAIKMNTALDKGTIAHELFHVFADQMNVSANGGALEEGFGIAAAKIATGQSVDLCEQVFGTKLYYRDIGIPGYPRDVIWGDFANGQQRAPMSDLMKILSRNDSCGLDYSSSAILEEIYQERYVCLNRNVDFDQWLKVVQTARNQTCNERYADPRRTHR